MSSQILDQARKYEETASEKIEPKEKPAFHLVPPAGWMNDPNGFSVYQGRYHMFFQYYPYASHWNDMHWGHAVSDDLLHWDYLPCALAPDQDYDSFGVFSGSAVTLADGRQLLIYTGVRNDLAPGREKHQIQTQCVAIGDGVDYQKYGFNPVIDGRMLPEGFSREDFRDPKILRKADGTYECLIANRAADRYGQILLFKSPDALHWEFVKVLVKNDGNYGFMWECPDFFELDGRQILLTSPQDMESTRDLEFHSGNGTLCVIGSYDDDRKDFQPEAYQTIDYGFDFYAPQTVQTPDGRRIMIGWMQNWDACAIRLPEAPWMGQMSIPRELSLQNGRLFQKPAREYEALKGAKTSYQKVEVKGEVTLEGLSGRTTDMEVTVRAKEGEDLYTKFSIHFAQNDRHLMSVSFRPHESVVKIDRKYSGSRRAVVHQRRCHVEGDPREIRLRLIQDRYSVEIFINDGEKTMTSTLYTELDADGVSFVCDGTAVIDVEKYDLKVE